MTRRLIEEKRVDELLIKWTGGDNLQPRDPYFSTINVLKDALTYFLADFSDDLDIELGTDTERDQLVRNTIRRHPGSRLAHRTLYHICSNKQDLFSLGASICGVLV